jgi:hypothetical protein
MIYINFVPVYYYSLLYLGSKTKILAVFGPLPYCVDKVREELQSFLNEDSEKHKLNIMGNHSIVAIYVAHRTLPVKFILVICDIAK